MFFYSSLPTSFSPSLHPSFFLSLSGSEWVTEAAEVAVPSDSCDALHCRPRCWQDHLFVSSPTGIVQWHMLEALLWAFSMDLTLRFPPSTFLLCRMWLTVAWRPANGFRSCVPCWTAREAAKTCLHRPRAGTHSACRRRSRWPTSLHGSNWGRTKRREGGVCVGGAVTNISGSEVEISLKSSNILSSFSSPPLDLERLEN